MRSEKPESVVNPNRPYGGVYLIPILEKTNIGKRIEPAVGAIFLTSVDRQKEYVRSLIKSRIVVIGLEDCRKRFVVPE